MPRKKEETGTTPEPTGTTPEPTGTTPTTTPEPTGILGASVDLAIFDNIPAELDGDTLGTVVLPAGPLKRILFGHALDALIENRIRYRNNGTVYRKPINVMVEHAVFDTGDVHSDEVIQAHGFTTTAEVRFVSSLSEVYPNHAPKEWRKSPYWLETTGEIAIHTLHNQEIHNG